MNQITVDTLFERLAQRGTGAYGLSDVTQLEHALQAAALANEESLGDEMIIAALFHDVGHLVVDKDVNLASEGIDDQHEIASAEVLQPLFGKAISEPVRLHVASKRYLCTTEPDYYGKLSEDSVLSLTLQGGMMSDDELATFRANRYYKLGVALRRIDDQAKVPALDVPPIENYRALASRLSDQHLHSP